MSKPRTILVPVPYHNYDPHNVIIGIRPADYYDVRQPGRILEQLHHASPGWASLVLCSQHPVSFRRANTLRPIASMAGAPEPVDPVRQDWLG
jgi:hypothetical protein